MELPGVPNGDLVFRLFKLQAEPWQGIAQFHLDQVLTVAKVFVEHVLIHITKEDEETSKAILIGYVDPFFDTKKETLQTKLHELLLPYTSGYGLSLEKQFHADVWKKATHRHAAQLVSHLEKQNPELFQFNSSQGLDRTRLLQAIVSSEDSRSDEFATADIIEMMLAYYQHESLRLADSQFQGRLLWRSACQFQWISGLVKLVRHRPGRSISDQLEAGFGRPTNKLEALNYPGMAFVPLPEGVLSYVSVPEANTGVIQNFLDICSQEKFKNLSREEMRLKWLVTRAA
jgi:hypothetical protein